MAGEGKPNFKDQRGDTLSFLLKATPQQLLEIAAGTALRADPAVHNFNNSQAPDKEDLLRQRIVKEYKRHADFRGMVIRAVSAKQGTGSKPAGGKPPAAEGGKPKGGGGKKKGA
jgi:hypothetical protein